MSIILDGVIWKYPVPYPGQAGRALVEVPDLATLLAVGLEPDDRMVVWAHVPARAMHTDIPPATRTLIVVNTGTRLDGGRCSYLGSVRTTEGIVWHVWEAA